MDVSQHCSHQSVTVCHRNQGQAISGSFPFGEMTIPHPSPGFFFCLCFLRSLMHAGTKTRQPLTYECMINIHNPTVKNIFQTLWKCFQLLAQLWSVKTTISSFTMRQLPTVMLSMLSSVRARHLYLYKDLAET